MEKVEEISIIKASENNLKNISLKIPRKKLVVITGLSGSGKSSLAFNTLFAEGQRRYIETFSAYARRFMGEMKRPDVEKVDGLSPVISIEQKTVHHNPRSTVGTITEIYDFLRLLYAKVGRAFSMNTGKPMVQYSEEKMLEVLLKRFKDEEILLLSPLVKARKGTYLELFRKLTRDGFSRVRVNGELLSLNESILLDRYKTHDIELVVDKLTIQDKSKIRISRSLSIALKYGKKDIMVFQEKGEKMFFLSLNFMCEDTGLSYEMPSPNTFSFNSKYGWCSNCTGHGYVQDINPDLLFQEKKTSLAKTKILPLQYILKNSYLRSQLKHIAEEHDFTFDTPIEKISQEAKNIILFGTKYFPIKRMQKAGLKKRYRINFPGVKSLLLSDDYSDLKKRFERVLPSLTIQHECQECEGSRLKKSASFFRVGRKNIVEATKMDIQEFNEWLSGIEETLSEKEFLIAEDVLMEIKKRAFFLKRIGLGYLSLNRNSGTLSGGEAQRIRLSSQINSLLVNILYILDEPSIGLHQRDNKKLIDALKSLRDLGNSIIVVEHDQEMMEAADYILDVGPGAGVHGGEIVAEGTSLDTIKRHGESLTIDYIQRKKNIEIPKKRRKGSGEKIILKGASGNNLKDITVEFPLGKLLCITGISGSGKSTLIHRTLYPILHNFVYNTPTFPMAYKSITGIKNIDKVIEIDQLPIGRTPRSNPGTYIGILTDIRKLYAELAESKMRGYKMGRFSFNVSGGRCEECRGGGVKSIEMGFLPDVLIECDTCQGKRFNIETLQIKHKGKSINDILNMTFNQAAEFFENFPRIRDKVKTIVDVGLGYLKIGQSSTTLSGGEAQRVKLASELIKKSTGKTFYIMDEPTTGLHFHDINILLNVINKLVDKGNTVLIIEHNLDVVKCADYVIEMGPDAGKQGGEVIGKGTPEKVAAIENCPSAPFLKKILLNK